MQLNWSKFSVSAHLSSVSTAGLQWNRLPSTLTEGLKFEE